jgi:hypothetical protein
MLTEKGRHCIFHLSDASLTVGLLRSMYEQERKQGRNINQSLGDFNPQNTTCALGSFLLKDSGP